MRFKPKRARNNAPSDTQTLESDREALPFPEGGVFSAKTSPTRPTKSGSRKSADPTIEELDQLFSDIRSGLDDLGDLLDQPFKLHAPDDSDDSGPRRAA